jgi:hypothetical protein
MNETQSVPKIPTPSELFESILATWPDQALIGIGLFLGIWIIGGNLLFMFSLYRRGIPAWKLFLPSSKVFSGLNSKEWGVLLVLAFLSIVSVKWGFSAFSQ